MSLRDKSLGKKKGAVSAKAPREKSRGEKSKERIEIQNELISTINHRAPTSMIESLKQVSFWEGFGMINEQKKKMLVSESAKQMNNHFLWLRATMI